MELTADQQSGLKALQTFYNSSLKFPAFDFRTFDEFFDVYGSKGIIYAENLGKSIRWSETQPESVKAAMESLAKTAQGRVPRDANDYFNALRGEVSNVSYLAAIKETVADVAGGVQTFGNAVITSASWVTKLLPFLVIGGVLIFFANSTGTTATIAKAIKSRRKKAAA